MEEIHNYPFNSVIKFKQPGRSFSYKVIKEGTYPNKESLAYTLPPNKYRIPDDYIIETTWGRSTNQYTVQCFINYNDNKPVFQVWYGKCFEYRVSSVKTATDAANLFHKHYTSQKGTKTSGIYLFGLQLKILDKARDRKRCAHVLKQIDQCSNSTLTRRATSTGKHMITKFNEEVPKFYNMEEIPQGNLSKEWTINKNINKLIEKNNYYEGHSRKPLFDMIPLDHWLPDELHVMLRITDRLWSLLIAELVEQNSFNDTARKIIIDEMKKIKVNFQFWQDQGSKTWNYTSLMGNDKLKVLQFFDLTKILSRRRAAIVRDLWDKFYELYIKMKDPTTNAEDFKNDAKNWLTLFLTPSEGIPNTREFKKGLYQPDNITPYIHVLVYHISEFMTIHHKWGLKAFSCSGIEKKNHEQVSYFFRKTMKDGGGKKKSQSSAIVEILQHENRTLFYNHNNIPLNCQNPKTIHIKTQDI
ncbi:hypothetical protein RclHR1_05390003 [Rhizophagus clarus]|uniref:Uncharacterized protein n=1 Tax=Rhizophagus clarus TaxID=94130 RepID=A0A2Z6RNM7_9GLOM|nr:hypothetical protein RclHR1_05390003 [Rhizophagus clarus]